MSLVGTHPAHDAYADSVATPIYLASYRLREEMEDIIRLKIALDVVSEKAPTLLTPEIENFHASLANFLDSLESFEYKGRSLAIELGFIELKHDRDIYRRDKMVSVAEASFYIHSDLKSNPERICEIVEEQESIAHSLLNLFLARGEALREKISDLVGMINKDVEFMQIVRAQNPITEENSYSAKLMKLGESLIDQENLPQVLVLCRHAAQSAIPVLQGSGMLAQTETTLTDKACGA
jgi:hypothetical protein